MSINPEIVGYCAAMLTTGSFIPQVLKVLRTKDTKSLSLGMYIVYIVGLCGWLAYGILLGSSSIIVANIVTISLVIPILIMKIRLG